MRVQLVGRRYRRCRGFPAHDHIPLDLQPTRRPRYRWRAQRAIGLDSGLRLAADQVATASPWCGRSSVPSGRPASSRAARRTVPASGRWHRCPAGRGRAAGATPGAPPPRCSRAAKSRRRPGVRALAEYRPRDVRRPRGRGRVLLGGEEAARSARLLKAGPYEPSYGVRPYHPPQRTGTGSTGRARPDSSGYTCTGDFPDSSVGSRTEPLG